MNGPNVTTTLPITVKEVFSIATSAWRVGATEAWSCSIQSVNSTAIVSNSYNYSTYKYNPHRYILIGFS